MDTAILIFSRTAREEAATGRYGRSNRQNIRVAQSLIAHTEQAARHSRLAVVRKYSASQYGLNFGERFSNAIEEVFAQGFARVIAIGTDTPGITPRILRRIEGQLRNGTLVTGPSADGGVYAIAMSRAGWNKAAFLQVRWQTDSVQHDLSAYGAALHLEHSSLAPLRDIDDGAAFNDWLHHAGAHTRILRSICAALSAPSVFARQTRALQIAPAFPREARRGPPAVA